MKFIIKCVVLRRNASAKVLDSIDLKEMNILKSKVKYAQSIINLTHILLSSLHVWSIDGALDKLFAERLSLKKPKYPIAFGRISRGAHFFVMFPPKRAAFNFMNQSPSRSSNLDAELAQQQQLRPIVHEKSINLINFDEIDDEAMRVRPHRPTPPISSSVSSQSVGKWSSAGEDYAETPSPSIDFWLSSKIITTEHLVAILAVSNAFMNLQIFVDLQIKKEYVVDFLHISSFNILIIQNTKLNKNLFRIFCKYHFFF